MARTTARVDDSTLVIAANDTNPIPPITVGSDAWFAWLETATAFLFTSPSGHFTARKERRDRGTWYWKAYRTEHGVLHRVYLGKSQDLTLDQLTRAAATLTNVAPPAAPLPAQSVTLPPERPPATARPADFPFANLLATKLFVPPARANLVARPRLFERLQAGLLDKLTLIAAPAGSGKTTLLSAWRATLAGGAMPLAWVALDSADNDPLRFWSYVIAAIDTLAPGVGAPALTLLQSPQPPPIERILTSVLNAFSTSAASAPVRDVALALDDYHVITTPAIHAALAWLLDYLPPNLHLVILTRADPALPLARLRARGAMTEIHASDLRFTPDEVATFLNQVMGLALTAVDVTALEARTEGWIAGLQLAALAMRDHHDRSSFIRTFSGSNRYIVDYLVDEVLQRQPPPVRTFLLQTAILDRLCEPLCAAVTQQADGSGMLALLERANLFVVPLDDKREWYRYHHLFADVLYAHALKEQPAQVATWHQRASAWYEAHGLRAEAIHHALAAADFARAADLVELTWPALHRSNFRSAALQGWMKALPAAVVRTRPVLSLGYAWEYLNSGELEVAAAYLQDAEQWLDRTDETHSHTMTFMDAEEFRLLPGEIASARTNLALAHGDIASTVTYARRALGLLPANAYVRRGPPAAVLGLAYWASGELEAAYQSLAESMAGFQQAGNIIFALSGTYGLADIRTVQGRLHEAVQVYKQALQLAKAQGEPVIQGTADLYLGLGELAREQGDLQAAAQYLAQSAALGEGAALPNWPCRRAIVQAQMQQTLGDLAGALDLLDEAARRYVREPVPDLRPIAALKARVWVRQGRLTEALAWVRERGLSVADDLSYVREFEHITLARVLIAHHQHNRSEAHLQAAIPLLARLLSAAETGGRMGSVIEILMLQALAYQAQDNIPLALAALARALTLAEPAGYVRLFVDEGTPMQLLILDFGSFQDKLWISQQPPTEQNRKLSVYADELLAAFDNEQANASESLIAEPSKIQTPKLVVEPSKIQNLVEPLSQRELEVLRLIADGKSNAEVAQTLVIALSTVKTHTNSIFGKLQVTSRTQALARAHAMRLI